MVTKVRNVAAPKVKEESGAAPRMLKISLTDGSRKPERFLCIVSVSGNSKLCRNRSGFLEMYTVDGQKVPDVHRRLICQKVSVSRNLSQMVIPTDEDFSCF